MQLEINVPSTLSEIPLKSYQKFLKVQEGSNDQEFIAQKMVQIFCDIELKDIVKMKLTSLNELILHFKNLFEQKPKFQPTFKIGNQEFGFITKLEDITFGEYVDLENNLLKWEDYHKAMAVMYRPIKMKFKDKYEIVDYMPLEEMQELMKFTPVDIAISSSVFFWNLGAELLTASLTYLEKEIIKNPKMKTSLVNKLSLENNGDGIKAFMHSQEETLRSLTQLPDMDLLSVSPISPLKNKNKKLNNAN
jgi:hemoglobin-like flavoprotein